MDIAARHFETKSDADLCACYIAQSVIGLGRVNRLHCWWMRTSASDSAVCDSVVPLLYPVVSWFSGVLGVGWELLLSFDGGLSHTPSPCVSSGIFGGVLLAAITLAVFCIVQYAVPTQPFMYPKPACTAGVREVDFYL